MSGAYGGAGSAASPTSDRLTDKPTEGAPHRVPSATDIEFLRRRGHTAGRRHPEPIEGTAAVAGILPSGLTRLPLLLCRNGAPASATALRRTLAFAAPAAHGCHCAEGSRRCDKGGCCRGPR